MKAIVTLRFPRNPKHDPKNKVIDYCPLSEGLAICTDVTGEHHSYVQSGDNLGHIKELALQKFPKADHVTRMEAIP